MQGCASSTLPRTQAEAKYLRSEKWCVSCAGHEVIAPETRGWQPFSKQPRRLFVLAGTTQRPQLQRFGLLLWYSKICYWTRERVYCRTKGASSGWLLARTISFRTHPTISPTSTCNCCVCVHKTVAREAHRHRNPTLSLSSTRRSNDAKSRQDLNRT